MNTQKNKYFIRYMFYKNKRVSIKKNKITSLQNGSTPGVYKIFYTKKNQKYKINLDGFVPSDNTFLWIADTNNNTLKVHTLTKNGNEYEYDNKKNRVIKIGILIKSAKIGDNFCIDDIQIVESEDIIDRENKISIMIPCHYRHFKHLENLLSLYENQTLIPNEIVIVICGSEKLEKEKIEGIENRKYKFDTKIIKIEGRSYAGNTRRVGVLKCTGDIIIFQDADDIPNPQRTEIINYYFNKFPSVMHICHKWDKTGSSVNNKFEIGKTKYVIPSFNMFLNVRYRKMEHVANGNIGIRSNIIKKINWYRNQKRKQDILTNIDIASKYKTLFIKEELYYYRREYSTAS